MIERDVNKRWEQGIEHHPKTRYMMAVMQYVASENGDYESLESGGDGDVGETIMFYMDVFFETEATEE